MIKINSKLRPKNDREQFICGVLSKIFGNSPMPARGCFPNDNDFVVDIKVKKSNFETLTISDTNSNLLKEPTWVEQAIKNYLNGTHQDMSVGLYIGKNTK